jgi:hypothetical protein
MTMPELMHACEALGVKLSLRLVVDAPRGALGDEHREALQAHRTALLVHLARREQWAELSPLRWGPAVGDPTPGIVVEAPAPIDPADYTPRANYMAVPELLEEIHAAPNGMTAAEYLEANLLSAAFARAFEAADRVNAEHPTLEILIYLDKQITTVEPGDLPVVRYLVIATSPGVIRRGNLEPSETMHMMTASIRAAAQYVVRETARMEAEAIASEVESNPHTVELPADVDVPDDWTPVAGRSAEPEDLAAR